MDETNETNEDTLADYIVKTYNNFDLDKISITNPHITKSGNHHFSFEYPDKEWILQTPSCKLLYKPEYSVCLHIRTDEFNDFIYSLDKLIANEVSKHVDITDTFYNNLLKTKKIYYYDNEHPEHIEHPISYFRINISNPTKSSNGTEIFDKNGEELITHEAINSLNIGENVKCLIRFKKIQLKKKKNEENFTLSLQTELLQIKIV